MRGAAVSRRRRRRSAGHGCCQFDNHLANLRDEKSMVVPRPHRDYPMDFHARLPYKPFIPSSFFLSFSHSPTPRSPSSYSPLLSAHFTGLSLKIQLAHHSLQTITVISSQWFACFASLHSRLLLSLLSLVTSFDTGRLPRVGLQPTSRFIHLLSSAPSLLSERLL
jgi:hypothetical protein